MTVHVWNFSLPKQPYPRSAFLVLRRGRKESAEIQDELMRHNLFPLHINPAHQRRFIDQRGLTMAGVPAWSGADVNSCTMAPPPPVEQLRAYTRNFDPNLLLFSYTADVISRCKGLYPDLRGWARNFTCRAH